ncbi:hypothetical protein FOS14_18990 [Skermania sp. ID1734]|uniref:hypothetical protein n=1 Tax=Skermania sp. ID1734 TaxID=2597516 RepID=UPI00118002DD|nr:hypothetical protein [Skermania sp. ID1734]TSD95078.1 hypothetical protein FOS14_18990 [Skermania sp. ID1734]
MPGKKLDRVRAKSAVETVRESPVIAAIAISPAVVLFGLVWWLAGFGWAIALVVLLVIAMIIGGKFF